MGRMINAHPTISRILLALMLTQLFMVWRTIQYPDSRSCIVSHTLDCQQSATSQSIHVDSSISTTFILSIVFIWNFVRWYHRIHATNCQNYGCTCHVSATSASDDDNRLHQNINLWSLHSPPQFPNYILSLIRLIPPVLVSCDRILHTILLIVNSSL